MSYSTSPARERGEAKAEQHVGRSSHGGMILRAVVPGVACPRRSPKTQTELQSPSGNMKHVAKVAALGMCLLMQVACSSRAALDYHGANPAGTDAGSYDVPIRGIQENSADAMEAVGMTAGPGTFSPDGPSLQRETHVPAHDGPVEQRMGGTPDLINGCTSAHFWLFPDEAFSSFCGDLGDACEFVCGARDGCTFIDNHGSPQETYCPAATGSWD